MIFFERDPVATAPGSDKGTVINYSERDGSLTFTVRVVPRASRSEIAGEHDGALRVRLTAPPVNGAANEELVRLLSGAFAVPRSAVEILAGHSSKSKTLRVRGARPSNLERWSAPND
jgi:uncharacterized protein (TIGR00251 family)